MNLKTKTLLNRTSIFTQNLWANAKTGLIICLLALYTLSSCEDPNRIGLETQPQEDLINAIYVDNLPVNVSTMVRDSVYTYSQGHYLVGSYQDPILGMVTAEAYGQMYESSITFLADEVRSLDSVMMLLDYADSYGDTLHTQKFSVYALEDVLASPLYANTTKRINWNELLGEVSFKPRVSGTNSMVHIRLKDELGKQILAKQSWTYDELMKDFPSWFTILPDVQKNTCILDFSVPTSSVTASNSAVKIYYKSTINGNTTAKVLSLQLIGGNNYNRITADRKGTLFGDLEGSRMVSSSGSNNLAAVQSGTGIRTYLNFPFLDDVPKHFGGANKIKIVKAELELKSQYATPVVLPPPVLYLSKATSGKTIPIYTDTASNVTSDILMLQYGTTSPYASYATTLNDEDSAKCIYTYTLPLTWYFNNILQGQDKNNGLIITSAENKYSTSRLLFGDQNSQTNPLRLKLYYIKLD